MACGKDQVAQQQLSRYKKELNKLTETTLKSRICHKCKAGKDLRDKAILVQIALQCQQATNRTLNQFDRM